MDISNDQVFERLKVIGKAPKTKRKENIHYICECECGNVVIVEKYSLIKGKSRSCGCLQKDIAKINWNKYMDNASPSISPKYIGIEELLIEREINSSKITKELSHYSH